MIFNILFMIAAIFVQAGIYYWLLNVAYKNGFIYAFVANVVSYVGILLLSPLTILVLFPITQPLGFIGNIIYIFIIYCITVLLQLVTVHATSKFPIKKLLPPILMGNLITYTTSAVLAFHREITTFIS